MYYRVFGGPTIESDGVGLRLTPMQARLIGLLLVRANQTVSMATLIDETWLGSPPARAEVALRMQIARVRKRLLAATGRADALATEHHGYRLAIAPHELDVNRFEAIVEQARHQDADDALHLLEKALRIARGEPLGEFANERWAFGVAEHWRNRALSVAEARFDLLICMGRCAQAADELAEATAAHPYRERRWAQQMVALYRSGRQAEALQAFHTARAVLVEELGIEPGRELCALERAVLRQDPDLSLRPSDHWTTTGSTTAHLGSVGGPDLELILRHPKRVVSRPLSGRV